MIFEEVRFKDLQWDKAYLFWDDTWQEWIFGKVIHRRHTKSVRLSMSLVLRQSYIAHGYMSENCEDQAFIIPEEMI